MWRALVVFVGLLLAAGAYVLISDGLTPHAAALNDAPPGQGHFAYALCAGAIALAATLMMTRPRYRMRR